MIHYYYITKRTNSEYETVANGLSWAGAMALAEKMEKEKNDGEYIVRNGLEKSYIPTSSYQSEMDWL